MQAQLPGSSMDSSALGGIDIAGDAIEGDDPGARSQTAYHP